ncbi:MAG: bifunctional methylenetetrahydrofolate dehydrogenase/methenyltetrahydrofolate cyclohydrolase [Gammaproteobacteria bacterium TMED1]|nr:MAG: bifunctional methylenetetrahydrofolate dehydrogenase/methenyltetrahydrofolate cyclohydrolase [Gammaproteobacteria bacterium TMED1]|tara:strand:- start:1506 stop:2393 length:888 start_codon:yes stop_codon:yes gene_type:complete
MIIDPAKIAKKYIDEVSKEIVAKKLNINMLGLIATKDKPSISYAKATQKKFADVGINYDLRRVARLELEQVIYEANRNPLIHGIFIYFPVFDNQQDNYLRNQVDYRKDIEAGSLYWTQKLYTNDRLADKNSSKKALLPCTPLAIIKLLTEIGGYSNHCKPLENKKVTIFNRSEVIGRPLAVMMSNDGAKVYSFDINGPLLFENAMPSETNISRLEALHESQIVITGVPNNNFALIKPGEINDGAICVNFSSVNNFSKDISTKTDTFIPRIGPMTVAMCMRNVLRLYQNYQEQANA